MLEKHYSPRAALTLFEGNVSASLFSLVDVARDELSRGRAVGIIAAEEDRGELTRLASDQKLVLRLIGSQDAPAAVATRLYATLRELDAAGVDVILVHGFREDGIGAAVQDRLRRAAGRVVRT